ncbi:MAG: hypothetical protein LBD23_14775 [Oscillospiraceae bacterium]|jgi:hypothetical protein|nr:hypothetical protein [Oscillospiraceae bacterium]
MNITEREFVASLYKNMDIDSKTRIKVTEQYTDVKTMIGIKENGDYSWSESGGLHCDYEDGVVSGDMKIYVYYDSVENNTILTNIKDDFFGVAGSSIGIEGKWSS